MLAPRELPKAFQDWNSKHKAPMGAAWWVRFLESKHVGMYARRGGPAAVVWKGRRSLPAAVVRRIGPFGFQLNSGTRRFEYPWAFFATPLTAGMHVVDVGAGAAGFQFALAAAGMHVTSVDPLINPSDSVDWQVSEDDVDQLHQVFDGDITFVKATLEEARLESASQDRIFAISVLEHLSPASLENLVTEVRRVLKPGGLFVATIDMFLDCAPFAMLAANEFGRNISVAELVEQSRLRLVVGKKSELCGFSEFDPSSVRRRMDSYLVLGRVMTQCVVLEKQ